MASVPSVCESLADDGLVVSISVTPGHPVTHSRIFLCHVLRQSAVGVCVSDGAPELAT